MQKKIYFTGLLVFVILMVTASLCCADQEIPNLVGTWRHKGQWATIIRDKNIGKTSHCGAENQTTVDLEAVISKQDGRIISGIFKSSRATEIFLGVIGHDNKTVYCADEDGFSNWKIINKDTIETIYRQVSPPQTVVSIGEWTRVK
jgi:hypothetical protein